MATFSNTDVRTASLKCFAAILSSHSPLVEVESWLLPGDSITSGKTSGEQNGKGMDATEVPRPWVMTHCLRQFSTNGMGTVYCPCLYKVYVCHRLSTDSG